MGWGPSKRLHVAPFSNGSCTCHPQCEVSMLCVHREVMWSLSQSLCQKNIDLSLKSEVEGLPRCHEAMATPAVLTNRMPYRATAQRQSEGCAKCTKTTSRLFAQSCKRAIYIYVINNVNSVCNKSAIFSNNLCHSYHSDLPAEESARHWSTKGSTTLDKWSTEEVRFSCTST
jgi:hypothetical protein